MLNSENLKYSKMLPYWIKMRDLYEGEKTVKRKGLTYLPPSAGMIIDGMGDSQDGKYAYDRYVQRAEYCNYIADAVQVYIGLLNQSAPTIELPKELEYLRENATRNGQSLEALLRQINTEQIKVGRCGLFVDLATSLQGSKPYLAFYDAESIINWNESDNYNGKTDLSMLVLRELVPTLNAFTWSEEIRYRVCLIGDGANPTDEPYKQGVFNGDNFNEEMMFYPSYLNKRLNQIPFIFINSCDCGADPDFPPLDDLANESLVAYRVSADYYQSIHQQCQPTLLVKGHVLNNMDDEDSSSIRTGAGAVINVNTDGDAYYIGVDGSGIPEIRQALENTRSRCESKAGKLIARGETFESGESLKTRLTAQTASLNQIAITGAFALEKALKIIAEWVGADASLVHVKPNLEFADFTANGDDIVKLMTAKQQGLPISYESIYDFMLSRGYVKIPYSTQVDLIKKEKDNKIAELFVTMQTQALAQSNSGLNPLNGLNNKRATSTDDKTADTSKTSETSSK